MSFDAARSAYEAGRSAEALGLLAPTLAAEPRFADGRFLQGLCLIDLGDFEGAEARLREASRLDRRNAEILACLGEFLSRPTRFADAEAAFRGALAVDHKNIRAVAGLNRLLLTQGRGHDALQVTTPVAASAKAPAAILDAHAEALKHMSRFDEALGANRRAVAAGGLEARFEEPSLLRELGRYEEAEAVARQALAEFPQAPGAYIIHGRTLQDLGRTAEAEADYRQALARAPFDDLAHEHLAGLLAGKTDSWDAVFEMLDPALAANTTPGLATLKARLMVRGGKVREAYRYLADLAAASPGNVSLEAAAAKMAMLADGGDPELMAAALAHAERAYERAFDLPRVAGVLGEACLAAGQPERAAAIADKLLRKQPDNQALIAMQAVAWRMMGDPRRDELSDYGRLVRQTVIETPRGWPSLTAYLADLAELLRRAHDVPVDAFGMVQRDGVQTKYNLTPEGGEAMAAFYAALEGPIRDYIAALGRGRDPLRRRIQGGHRTSAAWSVLTRAGGHHGSHIHTAGWLSSAFYVHLPPAIEAEGRQGWIKFGQPGVPTNPPLAAEHHVKPEPGLFVLFPSYMWHGTEPFQGEGTRLIMSVDVVPAPASTQRRRAS
jgi:Flp pilus assembly protein TadD